MISLRRTIVAGITAGLMAFSSAPAIALTTDEAQDLTRQVLSEMREFAESDLPLEGKIAAFQDAMNRYSDMPSIARYSLGVTWRQATDAQQQGFVDVFDDYLAQKYGQQFNRFDGQEMIVTNALDAGRRGIVVTSEVLQPGEPSVIVEWQFSDRSGEALLVDIIVEGISLLATERQEIASKLEARRGNLDQLIADLPTIGDQ